jgi:membrane protease subunit HflK
MRANDRSARLIVPANGAVAGHSGKERGIFRPAPLFFRKDHPYRVPMSDNFGQRDEAALAMSEGGPWGSRDEGGKPSGSGGNSDGPRNPWSKPSGSGDDGQGSGRGPSAIDELMRKARDSFGGGLPQAPNGRALWPYLLLGVVGIWLATTSIYRIGPQERGIVTFLGSYSRTLTPGLKVVLPAPFESVDVVDVEEIRTVDLGSTSGENENLMLTGDQNIINLGYSVRWNIKNPVAYTFQIAEPEQTISDVAESAMRATIANASLQDALGAGRTTIEAGVQQRMQEVLDGYGAGIRVQGVAIKQADPPAAVNDAFKEVTAAQQTAESYLNEARTYSQTLSATSQGAATAFDKVYEQYRLAPEITRRRMYYETMEKVLSNIDKTIIETNNVTPYLPLPALRPKAEAPAAEPQQQGGR